MFKKTLVKIGAIMAIAVSCLVPVSIASNSASATTPSPITMAMMGNVQATLGGSDAGDTWDSTWMANDTVMAQTNDGDGFGGPGEPHDRIVTIQGTPAVPSSLSGTDFNPGPDYNSIPNWYSSSIYEVGSVLYTFVEDSSQAYPCCTFYSSRLIDSTNGGESWSTPGGTGFFPAAWGLANFVKYGEGGAAPDVDNAQTYAYVYSNQDDVDNGQPNYGFSGDDVWLARVPLDELADLDSSDYEYYTGGDGMDDSNWSTDSSDEVPIVTGSNGVLGPTTIVYDEPLGSYVMSTYRANAGPPWSAGAETLLEAPHPWGPWTQLMDDSFSSMINTTTYGPYLTWIFLDNNAWTSSDGTTMWATVRPENENHLGFVPVYLTTNAVTTYQATDATNTGVTTSTTVPGYTGSGYETGFGSTGDSTGFTIDAGTNGTYMIQFTYNTSSSGSQVGLYVNGNRQSQMDLGDSDELYDPWMTATEMVPLLAGTNTISLSDDASQGDTGNFNLDQLGVALFSSTGTVVSANDNDPGFTYEPTGSWTYDNGSSRASDYDADIHYTSTVGASAQYTFTGTGFSYISDTADNLGEVDVSVDGVPEPSVDAYSATRQYQVDLDSIDGLPDTPHTVSVAMGTGSYAAIDRLTFETQVNDSQIPTYSAGWTYDTSSSRSGDYGADIHYTSTDGAYCELSFVGTGFQYISDMNSNIGDVEVYVDGSGGTLVSGYAPTKEVQKVLYGLQGLSYGTHTVKIVDDSDSSYYAAVDEIITD